MWFLVSSINFGFVISFIHFMDFRLVLLFMLLPYLAVQFYFMTTKSTQMTGFIMLSGQKCIFVAQTSLFERIKARPYDDLYLLVLRKMVL